MLLICVGAGFVPFSCNDALMICSVFFTSVHVLVSSLQKYCACVHVVLFLETFISNTLT